MSATPTTTELAEEVDRERIPLPGERRRVWVAYPPDMWLQLCKLADRRGISVPALIRQAIHEYTDEELAK